MIRIAGQPSVDQLNTADFDNPVTFRWFQTGRLGIQYDLTHLFDYLTHKIHREGAEDAKNTQKTV
jgi:hypothetical protein